MEQSLTYKSAGVDSVRAHELVSDIGAICSRTQHHRKLYQAFGLFAAAYDLSAWKNPVILAACDGVGTKLLLQLQYGQLEGAGVDLVAMNVNDILTSNAQPALFLDYIGIHHIDEDQLRSLISGMADALAACNCILAGGETAEMPDMVEAGRVELSGFCVGVAEKEELLDPSTIRPGDYIFGLPSNGFHANGWSLVRKVIERDPLSFPPERIERLLAPTRIYHPEVEVLKATGVAVKGMAHITGGGLRENIERILGEQGADLHIPEWKNADVQAVLSAITLEEAIHTFNMGFGWVVICAPDQADQIEKALPEARLIGSVVDRPGVRVEVGVS